MDIGKHYAQFGSRSPVILTLVLLIIIPSSTGYIDCRISCRRCHENTEHPAVLEVYCAMCEECKQRRRERMLGRTTKGKVKPTLKSLVRMRDGVEASTDSEAMKLRPQEALQQAEQDSQQQYQGQPKQQLEPQQPQLTYASQKALRGMVYPAGCPTPPICSDSEEEVEQPLVYTEPDTPRTTATTTTTTTTTTTSTTTTTTTTTTTKAPAPPCPAVQTCRKKKKKNIQQPCMNPCMVPPAMCPCPMYPPPPPQVPGYLQPPPQGPGYMPPPTQGSGFLPPLPQGPGFMPPAAQGPEYLPPPPQRPGCLPPPPQGPGCLPPPPQEPRYLQPPPQEPRYLQPPPQGPEYQQPNPSVPGAFPETTTHWPVQLNQPNDQQTQTPGIEVFENQRPVTQPQGPMVFPPTNQPSTMNENYYEIFIGLPENTI